ncbi:MAG: 50S ribosomal protein L5 [Candidatus Komeilibacteria bacterium]
MELLQEKYKKTVSEQMAAKFKLTNKMAIPRLLKVTVNVGVGKGLKDPKFNELVENTLQRITGQKPQTTRARKSIAAFKIRDGAVVGYKVTLRGKRMYDFLNKIVHIALPRVRDFHGLDPNKNLDEQGNLTIGFREHNVFPEIKSDEVERLHGMEVSVTVNAGSRESGLALFRLLGFPFKSNDKK